MKYSKITPEGTRDLLFEQCVLRRNIENRLAGLFKKRGFNEVLTPCIEYADVFGFECTGIPFESMYKLVDNQGRLLVLRPDSTMPIARLAATKLSSEVPIRLYYTQDVFRMNQSMSGKSNQIVQTGVELIGAFGLRSDLELIVAAIEALDLCAIPEYKLEIGHVGFFNALCCDLEREVREKIRGYIDCKNYASLNLLLDKLEDTPSVRTLRALPKLFGGVEVIEKAKALCENSEASQVLQYLNNLYTSLEELGQKDKIIIDLGLVHKLDYYSGVIYRGFIMGSGDTVLQGGRYDGLLSCFGKPMPATGFAVDIDSIINAMLSRGYCEGVPVPDVFIHAHDGYEMKALLYSKQVIEKGLICECSVFDNRKEAYQCAKNRGIKQIVFISDAIEIIDIGGDNIDSD